MTTPTQTKQLIMCDGDEIDRLRAINRDLLDAVKACQTALCVTAFPELIRMVNATVKRAEAKP